MSNAIFPTLPGLRWGGTKSPIWSTKSQEFASGREMRTSYWSYPKWKFTLQYEFLRAGAEAELQTLVGFFNARRGKWDSFLYDDPSDNTVTNQVIGNAAAGQLSYQLVRSLGGFVEPVLGGANGAITVKVGGVTKTAGSDYSVSDTGLLTFAAQPTVGAAITWSGRFFFRVAFLQDTTEFEQFMWQLWSGRRIEFQTVKP